MKLITRKSECRSTVRYTLVKSPKEAIRRTLSNYSIKDGIVKSYQPSYVTKEKMVLRNMEICDDLSIQLINANSFIITGN